MFFGSFSITKLIIMHDSCAKSRLPVVGLHIIRVNYFEFHLLNCNIKYAMNNIVNWLTCFRLL